MLHRIPLAATIRTCTIGFLLVLVGASVVLTSAQAQNEALTVEVAGIVSDGSTLRQAVVTVLDETGRPLAELSEEHFNVQVGGSAVPITGVSQGEDSNLAIAVVLVMDVSNSMTGSALEQAKVAAQQLLAGLAPQDSVAVVAFANTVEVRQAFTQDKAAAGAAISTLTASEVGGTSLYDATSQSVSLAAGSGSSRQAVILLSDGVDFGSTLSREEALATAVVGDLPFFVIALGDEIDRAYLEALARTGGGQFSEAPSPGGLAALYEQVGELLRGQYVIDLDAAGLELGLEEGATLAVGVTFGERTGGGERSFCLQQICVILTEVTPGERLEAPRTIVAQVISEEPVLSVALLVDERRQAIVNEPPYEFTFDPAAFSDGAHTLAVEVTIDGGSVVIGGELAVTTGPGGAGIALVPVITGAAIALVALVVVVLFLRLRGRGDGGQQPSEAILPVGPRIPTRATDPVERRPLWEDGSPPPPPPPPEEALGQLVITGGMNAGQSFPVGAAPISIGSGHRCLVRLQEMTEEGEDVAPELARVWVRDRQLMVHEIRRLAVVGSVGGGWSILEPAEVFTIGPATFKFVLESDGPEQPVKKEPEGELPNIFRDEREKQAPGAVPQSTQVWPDAAASGEQAAEGAPESVQARPEAPPAGGNGKAEDGAED